MSVFVVFVADCLCLGFCPLPVCPWTWCSSAVRNWFSVSRLSVPRLSVCLFLGHVFLGCLSYTWQSVLGLSVCTFLVADYLPMCCVHLRPSYQSCDPGCSMGCLFLGCIVRPGLSGHGLSFLGLSITGLSVTGLSGSGRSIPGLSDHGLSFLGLSIIWLSVPWRSIAGLISLGSLFLDSLSLGCIVCLWPV